jgi:flagellar biosynthesis/type III secretory pathway chaperone
LIPAQEPPYAELAELLQRKIVLLDALNDLLAREARAMASPGHEEIVSLAEEMQRLGSQLTELSRELDVLLGRSGYPLNGEGLASLVREAPSGMGLSMLHQRAVRALHACLTDNRVVGGLLERRRSAVERALRLLFEDADGTNLYHASGRLQAPVPNHLIGEA